MTVPGRDGDADLVVRDVQVDDLDVVARMHVDAFPDSVLGRLGVEAVRRNYQWQLEGPHDLTALIAEQGDRAVGFLFGGVFRGSTIGFIKREKWFLVRRIVTHPQILARGVGWNRLLLGFRLLVRRAAPPQPEVPAAVPERSFGVLAIAVDPSAQGIGVGGRLMAEALDRAVAGGFERMHLSVHPGNVGALEFYRSLGWRELNEPDGRWAGRMTRPLADGT